jgi:hypothetical protein
MTNLFNWQRASQRAGTPGTGWLWLVSSAGPSAARCSDGVWSTIRYRQYGAAWLRQGSAPIGSPGNEPTARLYLISRPHSTTIIVADRKFQSRQECSLVSRQRATVLGPVKAEPAVAANAISLDRPCARRLRDRWPGPKNDRRAAGKKNGLAAIFLASARNQRSA